MSGHSKWATIKHKKGAVDKARGKLFAKIARQIEVAARDGGGDPDTNATLRTMVQKAKAAQMTNDAIDRAIKRGTGENDGGQYEAITYEGYAPGGVALLIDTVNHRIDLTGHFRKPRDQLEGVADALPASPRIQFHEFGIDDKPPLGCILHQGQGVVFGEGNCLPCGRVDDLFQGPGPGHFGKSHFSCFGAARIQHQNRC